MKRLRDFMHDKDMADKQADSNELSDDSHVELNAELISNDDLKKLRESLVKISAERDEMRDQLMRTLAEFQNFRKRSEADKATLRRSANESLVVDLLPVLDNFERSMKSLDAGASPEAIMGGIQAVDRQLKSVLERYNVHKVESEGSQFNPEVHEALATHESDEHPEDMVVEELESGYRMFDKVIRPAKVKVSVKPSASKTGSHGHKNAHQGHPGHDQ